MKKIIATALACAMMFSLAACSKKPEQTSSGVNGTTAQTSAVSPADPSASAAETAAFVNPASEYVRDRAEKLTTPAFKDEDGEEYEAEEYVFHFPELLIKSSYADSINKEMNKIFAGYNKEYKAAVKGSYTPDLHLCDYIAYLTKDGILSLVFVEGGDNDCDEYHVYNIDVKTGEKVDNARIAQAAGVSDIRKAAMDALQNLYNNDENHNHTLKDYKIVKEGNRKLDEEERAIEKSFSEKHLNDKMKIGITNEGKMFFISEYETGAGEFFGMYDGNGKILYDSDNPYWVGERFSEDEDDEDEEGGDEDYDDSLPPIDDGEEDEDED